MVDSKNVFVDLEINSFDECIDFISKKAFELGISSDFKQTKDDLLKREKEMSTALLFPLAVPHTKSISINRSDLIFLRLNNYIDWNGEKVKIVISLFSFEKDYNSHIEMLSKISRKLIDENFRKSLEVDSKKEIVKNLNKIMKG
ncbi:MAG: PTS sugar transporter subunit IIA [Peptoniphilaceae bacterium]|nr:PTS sugar transporter subunit IIA [Peptoniphilaceae bacterium]MDD7383845.1 PTS sugar transporter subunit IIA [Peptoniphilaceae bacterium]MDY3737578.1 PTS sugar transporter subunit IIA [Peptoniphilaceae bacterium]